MLLFNVVSTRIPSHTTRVQTYTITVQYTISFQKRSKIIHQIPHPAQFPPFLSIPLYSFYSHYILHPLVPNFKTYFPAKPFSI